MRDYYAHTMIAVPCPACHVPYRVKVWFDRDGYPESQDVDESCDCELTAEQDVALDRALDEEAIDKWCRGDVDFPEPPDPADSYIFYGGRAYS